MRQVYVSEAAATSDAKLESAKIVFSDPPVFPVDPAVNYHYFKTPSGAVYRRFAVVDGQHVMIDGVLVHVDDVVPMGTAGTVKMPRTGNVLSVPRPDIGETIAGYYLRTCKQTGGAPQRVGELVATLADKSNLPDAPVKKDKVTGYVVAKFVPDRTGTPMIDWPLMVDWFANPSVYTVQVAALPAGAGEVTPGDAVVAAASTAAASAAAPAPSGTEFRDFLDSKKAATAAKK